MPTLQNQIRALAETFTAGLLAAVRSASLADILAEGSPASSPARPGPGRPRKVVASPSAPTKSAAAPAPKKSKGGRLARRSPADIDQVVTAIVGALAQAPEGLRSEHLQRVLKLDKKEITGPLEQALGAKKISKKGERRATTYFAK